jgi:hypothetical protein
MSIEIILSDYLSVGLRSSLPISRRELGSISVTSESILQDIDELAQLFNTQVCVHVLLEVAVMIVEQQHRSCSGSMTSGHIINAITDLEREYQSPGTQ